ncbi:hypothetical protein MAA_11124 [Metarhizium robertsii ARSEF 23]|uniref:Uncharacterized protein n=1 Tax=Metarhizium robertsii (strain ARSEF 23 / ATCC MYA-3075) TaxID=655844 RepID=A0A0B2XH49_METRA|nr:uncharacterized protein MAA_11124 [Metarhizium robertsii ARSEF 23]KHO11309.1 hypothetical protein MAA_11124 [Metarhizium robertsii ARSEF 23]
MVQMSSLKSLCVKSGLVLGGGACACAAGASGASGSRDWRINGQCTVDGSRCL